MFIVLLSFSGSLATRCISINSEQCIARPTLIYFNPDEHNQGERHYSFTLDRY